MDTVVACEVQVGMVPKAELKAAFEAFYRSAEWKSHDKYDPDKINKVGRIVQLYDGWTYRDLNKHFLGKYGIALFGP